MLLRFDSYPVIFCLLKRMILRHFCCFIFAETCLAMVSFDLDFIRFEFALLFITATSTARNAHYSI